MNVLDVLIDVEIVILQEQIVILYVLIQLGNLNII